VIRLQDIPRGQHTVRLVKVTGYTLANTTLQSMTLTGSVAETAPKAQELYVEYIGDSMFCGWGVVGSYDGKYTSQDGALAIPYLVSEKLGADFSVVAVSGQGAVFGSPNVENAYRYASYQRGMSSEFGFERKADAVVINLGTNDYSNPTDAPADAFAAAYERILRYARQKHGEDCKIIAVYNVMNDTYSQQILKVLQALGGEEQGFYAVKLDRTARVHTSHPTAEENAAYTEVLSELIGKILDGSYSSAKDLGWFEYETPTLGDGLTVVEDQGFGGKVHKAT
jgi:lysophospholipase L1-like esterase